MWWITLATSICDSHAHSSTMSPRESKVLALREEEDFSMTDGRKMFDPQNLPTCVAISRSKVQILFLTTHDVICS